MQFDQPPADRQPEPGAAVFQADVVVGLRELVEDMGEPGLLALINDILDFSKIESGKVSLEERSVDLRQLIHQIVDNLHVKAEEKGLALGARIDERVPHTVVGDPVKIGQVVTNLLGNAIKFTAQGSVTVALEVRERLPDAVSIDFRIADTGIGIAEDRACAAAAHSAFRGRSGLRR